MHNMFSKITSKKSRLIALAIVIITAIYSSCSNKEEQFIEPEEVKKLPVVKVDSIFIDLNSDIIQNKANAIDKVFSNLRRKTGFNGTVLYAEQGQIIYEKAWGFRDLRKRKDSLHIDDRFELLLSGVVLLQLGDKNSLLDAVK